MQTTFWTELTGERVFRVGIWYTLYSISTIYLLLYKRWVVFVLHKIIITYSVILLYERYFTLDNFNQL